ncbi:WW domain-containing protein [Dioscorea alata]|uniref:WW domain-containing protein n=1 Tax=Dioscorea alata TaxID=55571 RepID=A0ACB7UUP2_DIOAL|nr:WW domain-containing protein [Dioscorea alata]
MSSPRLLAQETQVSAPGDSVQPQVSESPVGGTPAVNGLSTAVSGSATPATSLPNPIGAPHGTVNEPWKEPIRANLPTPPGYVVSSSSFSYGAPPPFNSASGSTQQSSINPALKLTPSVPAAALQPPVPGHSFGNRPSFSYNVVSQANVGSASGQQFQPAIATNLSPLQSGKFTPAMTAASLQPPVPGQLMRPHSSVLGTTAPNPSPQMRMPYPISKGHAPTSMSYSFGGTSRPPTLGAPDVFAHKLSASDTAVPEGGTGSATSLGSQSMESSATLASSSAMPSAAGPSMSRHPALPPMASSFPVHPGTAGQLSVANAMAFSPNGTTAWTSMGSSPSLGSAVPSHAPVPPNPAPTQIAQNVQQNYPPYASLPAIGPSPQAPWLHPPLQGGMQHAPFVPFPGVAPTSFPQPACSMPFPSGSSPIVQPPGVSSAAAHGGTIPFNPASSQTGVNSEHERQGSEPSMGGGIPKNEEVDAWTVHKTEAGTLYYYNRLTGKSTYEKPLNFKGEPKKANDQPTPASWEKLDGTDWTLVTTNDGKKYYYDTKNKVSSWQLPAEVAELRRNQDNVSLKGNASPVQNVSLGSDKGYTPVSLSAPALQTGGRDSLVLRTSAAPVSSSALDLIKKKLQDAGSPAACPPVPAASGPSASDLNGSRVVEATVKGTQSTASKDKVKDANVDDNGSDSLSDSDVESGPSKEECIIQFKEMLKERGIAPFSKWDKELPKIVFDPRFKVC